jgi:hypothetical protein
MQHTKGIANATGIARFRGRYRFLAIDDAGASFDESFGREFVFVSSRETLLSLIKMEAASDQSGRRKNRQMEQRERMRPHKCKRSR